MLQLQVFGMSEDLYGHAEFTEQTILPPVLGKAYWKAAKMGGEPQVQDTVEGKPADAA